MSSLNEILARILDVLSVVSGGLELRLETPKEKDGEGEGQHQQQGGTKLYDADDEEGESSEVILSRGSGAIREAAAVTATPLIPHQDLVFKRKRPNSLTRQVILSTGVIWTVLFAGLQILQQRRRIRRSGRQSGDLVREAVSSPKPRRLRREK